MIKRCFIPMLSLAFLLTGIENAKAESTSVFDDSASFTVAKAVSLGRSAGISNTTASSQIKKSHSGNTSAVLKNCDANCQSCDHTTGKCKVCKAEYQVQSNGTCKKIPVDERNTQCVNLCGPGFFYDRPGAKNNGQELVCTRYKYPCGYSCTTPGNWEFRYLVNGTNYTCQDAIQNEDKDALCRQICDFVDPGHGDEYFYDRPGAKSNDMGQERVCTRYPYDCGYNCTTGWDFFYMVVNQKNGLSTNYTCQRAKQASDEVECNRLCGAGYHYDRPGAKNGGQEKVCTKYTQPCGYACTTGWDIQYLVPDPENNNQATNYTCQSAIQSTDESECKRLCGSDFHYDRPGAKNNGQEKVCTKYPLDCGYACTTGWNIDYLVQGTNYTCQTAIQSNNQSECKRLCGDGFNYDRPGDKNNGNEKVCTKYPLDCGYSCTTGWEFRYLVTDPRTGNATDFTCQTAIQNNDQAECRRLCGSGFNYDRPGALNNGAEKVCTKYPLACGYGCTTGWDIHTLVTDPNTGNATNFTCQTAIQEDTSANGFPVTDMLGTVRLQTTINNPHSATYTSWTAAGMTCADSYFATRDRANMGKASNQVVITPYGENVCGYMIANCPANCAVCNAGTTGYHPTCTTCNDGYTVENGACKLAGFPVTDAAGTVYLQGGIGTPHSATYTTYNANGMTCAASYFATRDRANMGKAPNQVVITPYGENACGYQIANCPENCAVCNAGTTGYHPTCTTCNDDYTVSNGACVQSGYPVTDAAGTVYLRNGIGTPNANTYTTYNANGLTCKSDWYATYQRVPVGNRETVILPYGSNACGYRKTSCPTHCSTCTTDDSGQTSTCTRCDSGYNLVDQGMLKVCSQGEDPCAGVSDGMPRFCTGGRYLVQGKGCCTEPNPSNSNGCLRCAMN